MNSFFVRKFGKRKRNRRFLPDRPSSLDCSNLGLMNVVRFAWYELELSKRLVRCRAYIFPGVKNVPADVSAHAQYM